MPQREEEQIQHQQQDHQNQGQQDTFQNTELNDEFEGAPKQGVSLYDEDEGMNPDGMPGDQWSRPEEGDKANEN